MEQERRINILDHFSRTRKRAKCRYCSENLFYKKEKLWHHIKTRHSTLPLCKMETSSAGSAPSSPSTSNTNAAGPSTSSTNTAEASTSGMNAAGSSALRTNTAELPMSSTIAARQSTLSTSSSSDDLDETKITDNAVDMLPISSSYFEVKEYERQPYRNLYFISRVPTSSLDIQLARVLCKGTVLPSMVEGKPFAELMGALNHSYQVPSLATIRNISIPALYNEIKNKIKSEMETAGAVCLSIVGWTSSKNISYIAVTAHYLNDEPNLKLCTSFLSCFELPESHITQCIADFLVETANEWGIKNKISAVVSDNSESVMAAVCLCNWRHVPCFAQSLNLVVQKGLIEIQGTLAKVKEVVQYFLQSADVTSKLEETQCRLGLPKVKLKPDVVSQWISTLEMLEGFLNNKDSILAVLALLGLKDNKFQFSDTEWKIIAQTVDILKNVQYFISEFIGENFVTISKVSILSNDMIRILNEPDGPLSSDVMRMCEIMSAEMSVRFANLETCPPVNQVIFLDPRFKKLGFSTKDSFSDTLQLIKQQIKSKSDISALLTSQMEKKQPAQTFFSKYFELLSKNDPPYDPKKEVDYYLDEPLIYRTRDPLEWWDARKKVYPLLYKIVLENLCLPSMTTNFPKKIFSKAIKTLKNMRMKKASNLSKMMLIQGNLD